MSAIFLVKNDDILREIFFQMHLKIFLYVQTIYVKYWKHRLRSVLYAGKKIMSIRHVVQKISWKQKGRGKNCVISKILTPLLLAWVIIWKFPPPSVFWRYFLNNMFYGHNFFISVENRSERMFQKLKVYRLHV